MKETIRLGLAGLLGATIAAAIAAGGLWWYFRTPKPTPTPISLPAAVTAHIGRICTIEATTNGKTVKWQVLSGPDVPDLLVHDAHSVHFVTPTPGDYRMQAITVVGSEAEYAETHVLVDSGPTPPVPPPPPVPPVPPVPPIPGDGLSVLIIYDSATDLDKYKNQLYSDVWRAYVRSKNGHYRVWDRSLAEDPSKLNDEPQMWKDVAKRDRKSLPWIVVWNGKEQFEGPVPDDVLALVKKYGGG